MAGGSGVASTAGGWLSVCTRMAPGSTIPPERPGAMSAPASESLPRNAALALLVLVLVAGGALWVTYRVVRGIIRLTMRGVRK